MIMYYTNITKMYIPNNVWNPYSLEFINFSVRVQFSQIFKSIHKKKIKLTNSSHAISTKNKTEYMHKFISYIFINIYQVLNAFNLNKKLSVSPPVKLSQRQWYFKIMLWIIRTYFMHTEIHLFIFSSFIR